MAFSQSFSPEAVESAYTMRELGSGESVKLRVMSDVLTGYSLWSEANGKPTVIRAELKENIDPKQASVNKITGKPNKIKQFIACVVWNYTAERFEVLETDKGSIIKKLWTMDQDPDLGDLKGYDIKITKNGSGMETRYEVLSFNAGKVADDILKEYEALNHDLTALLRNEDVFGKKGQQKPEVIDDVDF